MTALQDMLEPEALEAIVLLTRLGIRADRTTAQITGRVLAFERQQRSPVTGVRYSEAEAIGQRLRAQWLNLGGPEPLPDDDTFLADIVQFVLREVQVRGQDGAGGVW